MDKGISNVMAPGLVAIAVEASSRCGGVKAFPGGFDPMRFRQLTNGVRYPEGQINLRQCLRINDSRSTRI